MLSISSYRPLVYAGECAHQLVECGWASRLEEMRPAQSAAHAGREGVLVAVVFTASHISTSHRSIRVYVGVGFIGVSGSGTFKRAIVALSWMDKPYC